MEAISEVLLPYKEILGEVAAFITMAQFFSGLLICKEIYKKGNTKGISAAPFIGGIIIGILVLKYSMLISSCIMMQVNIASLTLNTVYLLFYCIYSEDVIEDVLKPLGFGVIIDAIFLGYAFIESPEKVEFRYGMALTTLQLLLLAFPLMDLKQIIDNKDSSSIPFQITFIAAVVSFLWLVYGIILKDGFTVLQNAISLTLCSVELALIFIYPGPIK